MASDKYDPATPEGRAALRAMLSGATDERRFITELIFVAMAIGAGLGLFVAWAVMR